MLFENQFKAIFNNKKVFVTGHTGFQGSWLTLWLKLLGSNVIGYALEPPTQPSLFETLTLEHEIAWAKSLGLSYLYTGPGYEQSSIYKSKFDGFQWFNGMEWSTDVEEYTLLCQRDSKIRSFKAYTEI